jgi:hypothetical protein
MNTPFSETDIWYMLEAKDFLQLTKDEKNLVLTFLTKEQYQQMRKLHLEAKKQLPLPPEGLHLSPGMGKDIFEKGKHQRRSLLKRWAMYQVPAWQAAAVALFLALTFYTVGTSSGSIQQITTSTVNSHDSLMGISLAEDSSLSRFMVESL